MPQTMAITSLSQIPQRTVDVIIVHNADGVTTNSGATATLHRMISDTFWDGTQDNISPANRAKFPHLIDIFKKKDPSGNVLAIGLANLPNIPLELAALQVFAHQEELEWNLLGPNLGNKYVVFNNKTGSGTTPDGIPYYDYIQCVNIIGPMHLLVHVRNYEVILPDGRVVDYFERISSDEKTRALAAQYAPDKPGWGSFFVVPEQLYGAYILQTDGTNDIKALFTNRTVFGGTGFMDWASKSDSIISIGFSESIEYYFGLLNYRKTHPW